MYGFRKDGEWYFIEKNSKVLTTPMGQPVKTRNMALADRLVADLKKYGESPSDPVSIVAFHYAMLDFFSTVPRQELESNVAIGLDPENDWTFDCPAASELKMKWMANFAKHYSNTEPGKKWLSTLSTMQLCAVCVIGRALESVNIPFIVATTLSPDQIAGFAKTIHAFYPYVRTKEIQQYLESFLLYFHLEGES